jgi:WD40 repeat protein
MSTRAVVALQKLENAPRLVLESGGHLAVIRSLLFTADGRELISVSDDKTIRVWSVSPDGRTAGLARTIRGQIEDGRAGQMAAAALSPPDSKGHQQWLAVGGYLAGSPVERDAIRLHDFTSGDVQALLKGHTGNVLALSFSPTGRWLASAGKDRTIRFWDLRNIRKELIGEASLVLRGHKDRITGLAWSANGHRLASASYDGTVRLWNTEQISQAKVKLVARLKGHRGRVRSVAFHPQGAVLVSGGQDRTIRHWQAMDGKSHGVLAKADHQLSALAFSPDGRMIVAGNFTPPRPKHVTLFNYPSGKIKLRFGGHNNLAAATAFHPGGQWLASGGGDNKEILLWSAISGEVLSRLEGKGHTINAVGFSKDSRFISWGHTSDFTSINNRGPLEYRFDLIELNRISGGLSGSKAVRAREKSAGRSLSIASGGKNKTNYRLHVKQGRKRLGTIERGKTDGFWHSAYTFTPDGQRVLSGGQNGELRLYSLDAKLLARLIGHTGEIKAVAISADDRWALSGSNDQTLILWDLKEILPSGNKEITPTLTIFPTVDGEWIAWTPDGFFTASALGTRQIGYSVNQGLIRTAKYISIDQLYDRFYRPDLVFTKLHGDPDNFWQQEGASMDVKKVIAGGLAPRVAFIDPKADTETDRQMVEVLANIKDQGGGIGKLIWKVNDTTVATDFFTEGSPALDTSAQQPETKGIKLKKKLTLLPGENKIQLIAHNKHNQIASSPAVLNLTVKSALPTTKAKPSPAPTGVTKKPSQKATISTAPTSKDVPTLHQPALHLLVAGINGYRDIALRLNFAVQDCQAIVDTMRRTGRPLFREIRVTQLFDDQVTTQGLKQAFHKIKQTVTPADVFILYLAGHGVTLDGRYYFLPQDFRYYNDDALRKTAVNQSDLQTWLAGVPARKSLVLIDTCESGSFSQSMVTMRGMAAKTAVAKLTRATGRATIVASSAAQPAAEGYQGHGVFTYVLLQGLHQADVKYGNRDGYTGLFELAAYVNDQVPAITMSRYNFEQVPQVHMIGTDFPIGRAGTADL